MDVSNEKVRVICGPTAAGKTRVAMWLATRSDVSIVSADSRQIYRAFDVGTAKPSHAERAEIPHYGIDVANPEDRASAAWWADRADQWIAQIGSDGRTPLVVGGTGLYLRALFGQLFAEPALDPDRRLAIQVALESFPVPELRRWTTALDPGRSHLGRTQLLRSIEIALLTGYRLSTLHRTEARAPRRAARYLVVDPGSRLATDIAERTRRMLGEGWIEEVRRLRDVVPHDAPAWNASGYGTIRELIEGRISAATAEERIVIETRQYAKRQRTWFRHQLPGADVTLLDPFAPDWTDRALAWWSGAAS